ncbi:MAG: alpha/beta hydrolase [Chitinophagaceae bacterium]
MRYFLLLMIIPAFFSACKKNDGTQPNSVAASTMMNVSYGADPKQKMDIYLPANRSADSTKLLFLIHGGGWTEGDKADFTLSIPNLQSLLPGYAFININYRLAVNGQNLFPTQENDVKAAVDFIFSKKNEYLISDKWVFLGASAGAHLALLQAYKYSIPVKAKAAISFFGPTELVSFYNQPNPVFALAMREVTGSTPTLNPTLYQQSSPFNYITAQSPPTLLLHGGADPLVPPSQSTLVRDKLQSLGVATQYVFYPNNGHGWEGADLLDSFAKISAFLQVQVH